MSKLTPTDTFIPKIDDLMCCACWNWWEKADEGFGNWLENLWICPDCSDDLLWIAEYFGLTPPDNEAMP